MVVAVCTNLIAPAAAVTPVAEVDVSGFAARADAWSAARRAHREASRQLALELAEAGRQAEADRIAAAEEARRAAELAAAQAEADRIAAEEAAAVAAAAAATTTTSAPPEDEAARGEGASADAAAPEEETAPAVMDGPTAAQWEALRRCESGGNYGATDPSGRYRGAYQFSQATWDWVAGFAAPHLVGIDPAAAAPADQDALALALWRVRGWSPWPSCGAGL